MEDMSKLRLLLQGTPNPGYHSREKYSKDVVELIRTISREAEGDEAVEVILSKQEDLQVVWQAFNTMFSFSTKLEDVDTDQMRIRPVFVDVNRTGNLGDFLM